MNTAVKHHREASGVEDRMERQAIPVACDHHRVEGFQKECVWCRRVSRVPALAPV